MQNASKMIVLQAWLLKKHDERLLCFKSPKVQFNQMKKRENNYRKVFV